MKTKITILLIALFVLAFSAQAFSDEKVVALIYGAETRGSAKVDYIAVQLDTEIDYTKYDPTIPAPTGKWNWSTVFADFTIIDSSTNIVPIGIDTVGVDAGNWFNIEFNTTLHPFGPDKNNLLLDYQMTTTPIPCVNGANLQDPADPKKIWDRIAPTLTVDATNSNHTDAFKLSVKGDVIKVEFSSNEALGTSPLPLVQIFADGDNPCTAEATNVTAKGPQNWEAEVTISNDSHTEGTIYVKITCKDVNNNSQTKEHISDVMYKDSTPDDVYVDNTWTGQGDVSGLGYWWQWDAFKFIQDGIDGVADLGTVIVNAGTGTYNENVDVNKSLTLTGAGSAIVTVGAVGDDNVFDVTASSVTISGFTANGANVEIYPHPVVGGIEIAGYAGIYLSFGVTDCNIHDNVLTGNVYGILLLEAENTITPGNNTFTSNTATVNVISGIEMQHTYGNDFNTNYANDNGKYGFTFDSSRGNTFDSNTANSNGKEGFWLKQGSGTDGSSGNTFTNNTANLNTWHGVHMTNLCGNSTYTGNTFNDNIIAGMKLGGSVGDATSDLTVNNNSFSGNGTGILIDADAVIDATVVFHNNLIAGNTTYGVNNGTTTLLDAQYNWWGFASGPAHSTNTFLYTGDIAQGNAVSDNVEYIEWWINLGGTVGAYTGTSFHPITLTGSKASGIFASIQTAIDAADHNDVIECKNGTFTEDVDVNVIGITIQGESIAATVDGGFLITVDDITIDGFTIKNGRAGSTGEIAAIVVEGESDDHTLTNNTLIGLDQHDTYGINISKLSDNVTIEGNVSYNWEFGIYLRSQCSNDTVRNNEVYDNLKIGIAAAYDLGGILITENDVHDNNTLGIAFGNGGIVVYRGGGATVSDNEIYDNLIAGIDLGETENCEVTGNDIHDNNPTNDADGAGIAVYKGSGHIVNNNKIYDNGIKDFARTGSAVVIDAKKNWWGDATGPYDNKVLPGGVPDYNNTTGRLQGVTSYVDYRPWCTDTNYSENVWVADAATAGNILLYTDTIQKGIGYAYGPIWDFVIVSARTYTPSNYIAIHESGLTLMSNAGAATTIINSSVTGNSDIIIEDGTSDVTVDGFTINNSDESAIKIDYNTIRATVKNNIINNAGSEGISTAYDAYYPTHIVDGATISGNTITDCHTGIGLADCAANCTISGNEITGSTGSRALYIFGGTEANKTYNNTITVNNIHDNIHEGINLNSRPTLTLYESNTISGNTITDNGSFGIEIANSSNITNLTVTGNIITGNTDGISIYTDVTWGTGNTINGNNISGNGLIKVAGYGINNLTTTEIDAEKNWWGSASGPTHVDNTFINPAGALHGDAVSDNVDYVKWYKNAGMTTLFAPVKKTEAAVTTHYSSIQTAITAASGTATITCDKGTFTEDFFVNTPGIKLMSKTNRDDVTIQLVDGVGIDIMGGADNFKLGQLAGTPTSVTCKGFTIKNSAGTTFNIQLADNPSGVFIDGNNINTQSNATEGISVGAAGASDLGIRNNTFTGDAGDVFVDLWGPITTLNVQSNIFTGPADGNAGSVTFCGIAVDGATIRNNTITKATSQIQLGADAMTGISYTDNTFTQTAGAILLKETGGDDTQRFSNLTINQNTFGASTLDSYGFMIFSNVEAADLDYSTIHVKNNNFTVGVGAPHTFEIVSNDANAGVKGIIPDLDATCNWWGDASGPSFDFSPYSGSGDKVSENVDFTPWLDGPYPTGLCPALSTNSYAIDINPDPATVNDPFDIRVVALNKYNSRNFDDSLMVDFNTNAAPFVTVPAVQPLTNGYVNVADGCMSTQAYSASDSMAISVWEAYNGNPATNHYSTLDSIVVHPQCAPAPPTNVLFADDPDDNGGWILLTYTVSVDDPFYLGSKGCAGVSYYNIHRSEAPVPSADTTYIYWDNITPDSTGSDDRKTSFNAPASDDTYAYRICSVHNPAKEENGDDNISDEPIPMGKGTYQSEWVYGSAAAKDNLPAYANIKVFLEGPYNTGGTMNNDLNGLPELAGAPANAVDVITVELRYTPTGATVKTADAYLSTDGSIINASGEKSLPFYYTTGIDYYIVISHRNHLDIMSATAKAFGDTEGEATNIDLTVFDSAYLNGFKLVDTLLKTGVYAMYAGDADENGEVNTIDRNNYWRVQTGTAGYQSADFDLNGQVNTIDLNPYWRNNTGIGTKVPTQTLKSVGGSVNVKENTGKSGSKVDVGITFTFDNGYLAPDHSYYEFDVMAQASETLTRIGTGIVYINYNTAGFGSSIHENEKVTVTKGTLTTTPGPPLYNIVPNDNTSSRLAVTFEYAIEAGWGNFLPIDPTDLIHVKIEIADENQTADLSFENSLMIGGQFYDDNATQYDPVIATDTDNATLPVVLSTFTARYLNNVPTLYWRTESETDNIGWYVYRNTEEDFAHATIVNNDLIPGYGTTTEVHNYVYHDAELELIFGNRYWYWIENVDLGGAFHRYGPQVLTIPDIPESPPANEIPIQYGLHQNIPNPLVIGSGSTKISFALPNTVKAELKIYNILGGLVRNLYSGPAYGDKLIEADWDGKDETGVVQAPGIYLYQLKVDGKSYQIKRLILLR